MLRGIRVESIGSGVTDQYCTVGNQSYEKPRILTTLLPVLSLRPGLLRYSTSTPSVVVLYIVVLLLLLLSLAVLLLLVLL